MVADDVVEDAEGFAREVPLQRRRPLDERGVRQQVVHRVDGGFVAGRGDPDPDVSHGRVSRTVGINPPDDSGSTD
ncbi:hypothetical protein [Haloarcula pelagica]|uniref:hypothetical protein n=1 Tax=Haloarcula pelagica TaxID=3033389 RepID=UPI003AF3294C